MKKLAFFIHNISRRAGSERACALVADALAGKGFDVTVLSVCGDNTCAFPVSEKLKLVSLTDSPEIDNKKNFFRILSKLSAFYRREKPDVVIDIFPNMSLFTLLLKPFFGFSSITWEHSNFDAPLGLSPFGRKLAMRFSDAIAVLSEADRERYIENLPRLYKKHADRIHTIYNFSPYERESAMHDLSSKSLIAVGRLEEEKGFDRLVNVWESVEPRTDCELNIYGDGALKDSLQSLIDSKGLKRIHLCGSCSDIDKKYMVSMLLVATSHFEGFPLCLLEAQSFGLPIVSFDFRNGPKEIISDGSDGYVIPSSCNEENEMAERIIELASDREKLKSFSENVLRASSRFTLERSISRWEELLQSL